MGTVYADLTLKNSGDLAKAREGNINGDVVIRVG